jgi:probable rRNA maturation factor
MPVTLDGHLPVSLEEAEQLWGAIRQQRAVADNIITVRVVTKEESQRLKREYKKIDEPTNVLTFSYPHPLPSNKGEGKTTHDIALCLAVAKEEASERGVALRDYVAWLLVHAYLHATGLDHEVSETVAHEVRCVEHAILQAHGFTPYGQL